MNRTDLKDTASVTAGKIYVTAFLDFKTFKKFAETLAWETEVLSCIIEKANYGETNELLHI
jgi:hypothetical protein